MQRNFNKEVEGGRAQIFLYQRKSVIKKKKNNIIFLCQLLHHCVHSERMHCILFLPPLRSAHRHCCLEQNTHTV